jgi:hypothetical protein
VSTVTYGGKPTDEQGQSISRHVIHSPPDTNQARDSKLSRTNMQIAEEFCRLMIEVDLLLHQDEQQQEKAMH